MNKVEAQKEKFQAPISTIYKDQRIGFPKLIS